MKKYILVTLFLVLMRTLIIYFVNPYLNWSPDEDRNYEISTNYLNGRGYTIYDNHTKAYRLTAFHPSSPVFAYTLIQRINFSKKAWALVIYSFSIILYILSIFSFQRLSSLFIKNKYLLQWATIIYAFYPSLIFYIGGLLLYENIVTPLLVIVLYRITKIFIFAEPMKVIDYVLILLSVLFSCLFRPSSAVIYILIFLFLFLFFIKSYLKGNIFSVKKLTALFSIYLIVFLGYIPTLIKNHNMFGHYIPSTEQNFVFLEGHNPYARGSWSGNFNNKFYSYVHDNIPNFDNLDEYQQSIKSKNLGIKWIINNPVKEIILCFRKLAIYFLPQNYDGNLPGNRLWNPINLSIHLLFFSYFCSLLFTRRFPSRQEIIILSPIFASLVFSLVMFVGYRWRYYAEPFMILSGFKFLDNFIENRRFKNKKFNFYFIYKKIRRDY